MNRTSIVSIIDVLLYTKYSENHFEELIKRDLTVTIEVYFT